MRKISIPILVILVSITCFSLMIGLWLFHLRDNKPVASLLNTDQAMLFPVGRDIKPIDLITAQGQPFTQRQFINHWTLLLFGFTHCNDVCPINLAMLGKVYHELYRKLPNLQVVLVSLDPERDNKADLNQYVKKFNSSFIGVSGSLSSLRKLQSNLGIYAMIDKNKTNNYQIQHSSSIMLINPQGKWVGLFKYGMSPQEFNETFNQSLKLLTDRYHG